MAKRGYVRIVDHKNYNPRLIQYLTDSAWIGDIPSNDYLGLFLRKLDNPVEIWEHAFRNQLSDRARHFLFVLTTMPRETRIKDLEQAFVSFHNSQCSKFTIGHSATDFSAALKELDGTFVATKKIGEEVLAQFQNPSIRDFMQYLLLSGESLSDIIESLVFFEQAHWFVETLNEEKPQVPVDALKHYIPNLVSALKRLADAASCSINIYGTPPSQSVTEIRANVAGRVATIGSEVLSLEGRSDDSWICERIGHLAKAVEDGKRSERV